jgi:hypothetical protein
VAAPALRLRQGRHAQRALCEEAALIDYNWRELPEKTRRRLRAFADDYKRQNERRAGARPAR